jgi:hypothetical protein
MADDPIPDVSLRGTLTRPERDVTVAELAASFRSIVIEAHCGLPGAGLKEPDLLSKIRGALGRELHPSASPDARANPPRPCPWNPPCTYDVLFGVQGWVAPNREIPKPYVLALDTHGDGPVRVRLTLFGLAEHWAPATADALIRALRAGVADDGGLSFETELRTIHWVEGLDLPLPGPAAVLEFLTPLAIDTIPKGAGPPPQATLFRSLAQRVEGVARWQGVAISRTDLAALQDAWMALRYDTAPASPQAARPRARQYKGRDLTGFLGRIVLTGDLAALTPLLALGAHVHIGGQVAWGGFGRCTLTVIE